MHKYCTGTCLAKTNQFSQNFDQLATLLASGQKWSQGLNFDHFSQSNRSPPNGSTKDGKPKPH